jgi:uncharacterized protein (TIGR03066 family)
MRTFRYLTIVAMAAALVLSLAACTGTATIEGKWLEEEADVTYTFEDGTMTISEETIEGEPFEVSADYEVDGDTLTVTFEGAESESVEITTLTEEELTLTADDGESITLSRQ